jgi:ribosomal protein S17
LVVRQQQTAKMKRTIIIRRDYLHYITKYNRFEKRHSTLSAHCSPAFLVKEGDKVRFWIPAQCLSFVYQYLVLSRLFFSRSCCSPLFSGIAAFA